MKLCLKGKKEREMFKCSVTQQQGLGTKIASLLFLSIPCSVWELGILLHTNENLGITELILGAQLLFFHTV